MKTLALLATAAIALIAPTLAFADQPIRQPAPIPEGVLQGICAFPVGLHIVAQDQYAITFANGEQLVTGLLFVQLTNLDNGSSIEINISGPAHITTTSDGSMTVLLLGRSAFFDLGPDGPSGLFVTSGPVELTYSQTGAVTGSVQFAPAANVDLCAALADG